MANSASGIAVNDECKLSFLELKARRTHRYVVFKIDDDTQQVIVEKTGAHSETYEDFTRSLPDNDCRYAVFDYDFTTDENCHKSKIFFIAVSQPVSPLLFPESLNVLLPVFSALPRTTSKQGPVFSFLLASLLRFIISRLSQG